MPQRHGGIGELFAYRELLVCLVWSNLRLRYRRSYLGFLWQILNPVLLMGILALVFSHVLRTEVERYPVFLLAGLLPWTFFSQAVTSGMLSVVENQTLIRKVYIPKLLLPVSAVLAQMVDSLFSLLPLGAIALLFGSPINLSLVSAIAAMFLVAATTLGLALTLSALFVSFRDVSHFVALGLQAWFYLTPIVYSLDMLPESYRPLLLLNPMASLVDCFRAPFHRGEVADPSAWLIAVLFSMLTLLSGLAVFKRREARFIFELSG